MKIKKEWRCLAHGFFESAEPICTKGGCTTVERVILTPPGFKSLKTKASDATFNQLAADFGLSDMRGRAGEPARVPTGPSLVPRFGSLPKGGTYRVDTRTAEGGDASSGVYAALAENHAPQENRMADAQAIGFKRQVIGKRDPDPDSRALVMKT